MKTEDRAKVLELREQGLGYGKIAAAVGTSKSSVFRALNPTAVAAIEKRRAEAKKEWNRKHYFGRCYCGAKTNKRKQRRCVNCEREFRRQRHELMLDTAQAMYEEEWSIAEMSQAFGHKTRQGVAPLVNELHKAGRIGYRRVGWADR